MAKSATRMMVACVLFGLLLLIVPGILFVLLNIGIIKLIFQEMVFYTPRYQSWEVMVSLEPIILYVKLGLFSSHIPTFICHFFCPSVLQSFFNSSQLAFKLAILNNAVLSAAFLFSVISCFPGQWWICFTVQASACQHWWPVFTSRTDNLLLFVFSFS